LIDNLLFVGQTTRIVSRPPFSRPISAQELCQNNPISRLPAWQIFTSRAP